MDATPRVGCTIAGTLVRAWLRAARAALCFICICILALLLQLRSCGW
jgi:hypothetical protein